MKVKILFKDIVKGDYNDTRKCPLARAIRRKKKSLHKTDIHIGTHQLSIRGRGYDFEYKKWNEDVANKLYKNFFLKEKRRDDVAIVIRLSKVD